MATDSFNIDTLSELLGRPLDEATREALRLAYVLSTQVEEGRPLRFALLLSEPNVSFPPERVLQTPVSGDGIRRLCLASVPGKNCWRLRYDPATKSVAIIGLANYFESFFPMDIYDETIIDIDGPGSIAIRIGSARAKYARGRHYPPTADETLRSVFPQVIIETVARQCFTTKGWKQRPSIPFGRGFQTLDGELYAANRTKLEDIMKEAANVYVPGVVLTIVDHMRQLRHGGCVVLTIEAALPDSLFSKANRLGPPPATTEQSGYNAAFLSLIQAEGHRVLAEREKVVLFDQLKPRRLEEKANSLTLPDDERAALLEEIRADALTRSTNLLRDVHSTPSDREAGQYARLCARLSTIDGIVVLDPLLEPAVFGGLVSIPSEFTGVKDKGARHRSAACCATQIPGCLALVVSQDGSVTAYREGDAGLEEFELLF